MNHKLLLIVIAGLTLVGCANNPLSSYKNTSDKHLNNVYTGNLMAAMQAESTSDVLYNMEYGSLLRLNQSYESSNLYFSKAQSSIDLWALSWANTTGGKLSTSATALLINDSANDYEPRGYEKTFLTTLHALNQMDLNNLDNARVEIKRMYQIEQATQNYNQALYNQEAIDVAKDGKDKTSNYLQSQIIKKYDFSDIANPQVLALKNSYQNAFSHYLAGFVFEALNEPSLARPGYLKSGQLNPSNPLVQSSIDNIDKNVKPKAGFTDLLIVEETGHAPQIKSVEVHVPINLNLVGTQNSCVNMINIFYPKLMLDRNNAAVYNYKLDNQNMTPQPMVDVNLMAARAIKDNTPHIISRNIAAALRNIATSQAACSAGGSVGSILSLGTSITGALLDTADERAWTLLPSKININRTTLAYGKHIITVNVNGVDYTKQITLSQPYQIITFRVIGNQVLFDTQRSMLN
jgi:hypothetical protein